MSARDYRSKWSDDHGRPGLRDKFAVYKASDRLPAAPGWVSFGASARIGGPSPDDEFVFVLRPESDAAAWSALQEYAAHVVRRDPRLAHAITQQLVRIYQNQEPSA